MSARPPYLVDHRKIVDYLLNLGHSDPQARAKALFFFGYGFSRNRPSELAAALIDHAISNPLTSTVATPWGNKLVYEGDLQTPNGSCQKIRSVWIVRGGSADAELVSAYRF